MTPLCEIVETLLEIQPWPWKSHPSDEYWILDSCNDGVVTARNIEKKFILSSPRWLAELVVRLVEERTQLYFKTTREGEAGCRQRTLQDFDITPEQFEEIKRRLEK